MNGRRHRVFGVVGTAFAGAALFAGGVQAAERPDDRGGRIGVGALTVAAPTGVFERAVQRHMDAAKQEVGVTSPDWFERAVLRARGDVVRPDDRGGMRGPGARETLSPSVSVTRDQNGFAWDDAAFGAAAATFGAILLGALATFTVRHRRRVLVR